MKKDGCLVKNRLIKQVLLALSINNNSNGAALKSEVLETPHFRNYRDQNMARNKQCSMKTKYEYLFNTDTNTKTDFNIVQTQTLPHI